MHILSKMRVLRVKHISDTFNHLNAQWTTFAAYWLAIPLRGELILINHQIGKRVLFPSPFYNAAPKYYKDFKETSAIAFNQKQLVKNAYNIFRDKTAIKPNKMCSAACSMVNKSNMHLKYGH
jgi:hypothetical protein